MKVGVTGTREGMILEQRKAFCSMCCCDPSSTVDINLATEFHHGSCRGVDVQAARIVNDLCNLDCEIHCHPGPSDDPNQENSGVDTVIHEPKNHFARNRNIVDTMDLLIVVPREKPLGSLGGTVYTAGYARKKGKRAIIIWPDGTVEDMQ